jgi:SAM-dependent methyltransferase
VNNREFDRLLPQRWRRQSDVHFTPAAVARRAADMLVDRPGMRVLDVGAAVGKFCILAARHAPDAAFLGVERRPHLVRIAERLARQLGLPNVTFACADAMTLDWSTFDAFYLFNPFAEHLRCNVPTLDRTLELDPAHFLFYVQCVWERLAAARAGTRVVTYHGFGTEPPPSYVLTAEEDVGTGSLQSWVKADAGGAAACER